MQAGERSAEPTTATATADTSAPAVMSRGSDRPLLLLLGVVGGVVVVRVLGVDPLIACPTAPEDIDLIHSTTI